MRAKSALPILLILLVLAMPGRVFAGHSSNPPAPCDPSSAECPDNGGGTSSSPDGGDSDNPPILSLADIASAVFSGVSVLL